MLLLQWREMVQVMAHWLIWIIIAGTCPLAADMAGAVLMGFETDEVPAIVTST